MFRSDDSNKTREQLMDELKELRRRTVGLENVEIERDAASKALRESEKRLSDAQRVGKMGCFSFDLTTGLWSGTDMLYPILGVEEKREYSIEEWVDLIHPDHQEDLATYHEYALEQKIPFDKEYLIVRQTDGETRWVHTLGEFQSDDSGNVIRIIGTTRDITESKKAEETLRDTQKLLLKTESLAQVGSWKWNLATNEVQWSPEMYRIYQYDPVEYPQIDFSLAMSRNHPDDVKKIEDFVQHAMESGITTSMEYRIILPDSSIRHLWSESEVLENPNGEKTHLVGYVQDVTERKQVEEALRNQNNFMNNVMNSLWDTVYIFDQETGAGVQWNKALEEISGYDYEKVKDCPPTHFYPEEEHERIDGLMKDIQEHGHGKAELTYIISDGSRIPFEYSVVPVTGPDKQAWMCAIGRDLTERKNMEAQLRQSQKMDALGKLTGGIAHDYNNMLGVIVGYSHLLQDALKDDPVLNKYVNAIQHASERGGKLSRKLMGFSHNIQPQADVVNVNEVLISEQDMLQKTLTPRIDLIFDFEDNLWPIYVNSSELEDAILNLCINAMHAMESDGKLAISTSNQHLNSRDASKYKLPSGDSVLVTVSDTGVGIDSHDLNFIFDPFFTTKGEKGVGLGLSMVYGFVQRSAGIIAIDSVKGSGSEFKLYFPRCTKTITDKPESGVSSNVKLEGSETILVVDDEPALVDLCKDTLEAKGYRILVAKRADEALEIFTNNAIDMLISDVIMPGMDGYQLASKVREINPNIKILLVSGFTENKQAENNGFEFEETLLQKPFSPKQLLVHVRRILDGHQITEKKCTVMVMDDDEDVQKLFEINLKKLGFEAVFASNGEDAVTMYSQSLENNQAIDIVILDVLIPGGVGGKEVAERILALNPDAKLIVSSGDTYGREMMNYQEYGFKATLEKDFDSKQMMKILTQVYESD